MEIKGKTAVVTGGGSGIGRATAVRLAAEGAAVLTADLDEAGMRETVRLIESAGGRAAAVRADVTDAEQARHMMDTALSLFGRFDILHNNAGIAIGTPPFPQCDLDRWRRVLDIDLQAVILGCFLAGPMMQRGGGGAIVNTASMAGLYPYVDEIRQGAGHQVSLPKRILKPEQIADGVVRLIRDDALFGRALEVRPSEVRLVDVPGLPRSER
jgi:NAD(P)-dependent dehydrogenase (short-subunit alcohol dehydrogenase family)